jgi:hypothetical protein
MAICDELLLEIETKNEPAVKFVLTFVIANLSVLGEGVDGVPGRNDVN